MRPRTAAVILGKVLLSKAHTIFKKMPNANFFFAEQLSIGGANTCRAVSIKTPTRKPYREKQSFVCNIVSLLK